MCVCVLCWGSIFIFGCRFSVINYSHGFLSTWEDKPAQKVGKNWVWGCQLGKLVNNLFILFRANHMRSHMKYGTNYSVKPNIYMFFSSCVVSVWFCWVWYEFGAFNSICAYTYYLTIVNVFSCSICFKSNGILFVFVRVGGTNKMPQSTDVQIKTRTSFLKWSKPNGGKPNLNTLSAKCTEIEQRSERVIEWEIERDGMKNRPLISIHAYHFGSMYNLHCTING